MNVLFSSFTKHVQLIVWWKNKEFEFYEKQSYGTGVLKSEIKQIHFKTLLQFKYKWKSLLEIGRGKGCAT